jgi:hypothetical protein
MFGQVYKMYTLIDKREWWIGKDFKASNHGLNEVLSLLLPGDTAENHTKPLSQDSWDLLNTHPHQYSYANPFGQNAVSVSWFGVSKINNQAKNFI